MRFTNLIALATFALSASGAFTGGKVTFDSACTSPSGCSAITSAESLATCLNSAKEAGCKSAKFERLYAKVDATDASCSPPGFRRLEQVDIPTGVKSTFDLTAVRSDGASDGFKAGKLSITKLSGGGVSTEDCSGATLFYLTDDIAKVCAATKGEKVVLDAAASAVDKSKISLKDELELSDDISYLLLVKPTTPTCTISAVSLTASTPFDLKSEDTVSSSTEATSGSIGPYGGYVAASLLTVAAVQLF